MSTPPVDVSIVVPTHNTRGLTLDCLEAIVRSTALPKEIIVVDDGSHDGTAEAITGKWPRVRVLGSRQPVGFSAAANIGLRAATGTVLLLLNSDTEVDAGALDALLAAFDHDRSLGIAGAQLRYPDGRAQWSGGSEPSLPWLFFQASNAHVLVSALPGYRAARPLSASTQRKVEWVTGAAMAIRRTVWDQIGPLDEAFQLYAQDLDFCVRARQAGWQVAVVPAFSVMHHRGATIRELSGASDRQNPSMLWRDLIAWAAKRHGQAYSERARTVIAAGARARLLAHGLARFAAAESERSEWDARTNALRAALRSLYAEPSSATHE